MTGDALIQVIVFVVGYVLLTIAFIGGWLSMRRLKEDDDEQANQQQAKVERESAPSSTTVESSRLRDTAA